jgi:sortase A
VQKLKILLSWLLVAGGSYVFFSGAHEFYSSRTAQKQAAQSWNPSREASYVDGRIVPEGPKALSVVPPGETFARLSIPRLQQVLYVVEGTEHADLRRGPGHLEGSALPGSTGNCVIAGHRDTHFRALKDIHKGDDIELETAAGKFTYRVSDITIVSPNNTESLQPSQQAVLNLITCYPFYYVGSAPKRFIVHAEMVTSRASRGDFPPAS